MHLQYQTEWGNEFESEVVRDVFCTYSEPVRSKLLFLRQMTFDTAGATEGVGKIAEILKWGQPSYLTQATKSGSTIRIDRVKNGKADYAIYFHCQTTLVDSFKLIFGSLFKYEGNRAILFHNEDEIPTEALRECIKMALTYHLAKKSSKV